MITGASWQRLDIPPDAALAGIQLAAQPERMLELCREQLGAIPAAQREAWTQCIATEAVYQPGRACRIAYALGEEEDGRATIVYARWPAEARTHASAVRVENAGGAFDVFRYPRDRRLRQVRAMRRQDWLRKASEEWFARRYGAGRFAAGGWRCSPVKYVPESRLVCRLKGEWVTAEEGRWRRAYVRISRRRNAAEQFALLEAVHGALGAAGSPLTVPLPLGAMDERHLLATEFVRGRTLRDVVAMGDVGEAARMCGRLAGLSRVGLSAAAVPAARPAIQPLAMLDELASAAPGVAAHVRRLLAWADGGPPTDVGPALVHGDLHAGQIILKGDRVVVVDWERCHLGDPTQDIMNLAAEMETSLRAVHGPGAAEERAAVFVGAWRRAGGAFHRRSARWWATRALVLRAWGLLRHLRPDWPRNTERLLERAERIFHEGCAWTESA